MNKLVVIKPLFWIASSRNDLQHMPEEVRKTFGYALHQAQEGSKHENAKPLKGFSGAGILEVVEDFSGNTFRAVYTVRFKDAVYALHVFQKKSKKGIATPKHELDLISSRLKRAEEHYIEWIKGRKNG